MSHIYDEDLRDMIRSTALELESGYRRGSMCSSQDLPNESPHEGEDVRDTGRGMQWA